MGPGVLAKWEEGNTVQSPMLRVLLAVAAVCKWKVKQMDIVTTFLYGIVEEEVYMVQPPGYEDGTGREEREVVTPLPSEFKLIKAAEGEGVECEDQRQFQSMDGSLIYAFFMG
ncbi:hypothetical protein CLOM_g9579 [Closterium sp. NIES-68]|nr:hypothetical protein CLOM_g9579 [Closterium sp. NIES-68]